MITFPDPPGGSNLVAQPTAKGFLLDFAVGLEIAVLRNLFVVTDLGYQAGFQSNDIGDRHTSYLHVGAGFAVGL